MSILQTAAATIAAGLLSTQPFDGVALSNQTITGRDSAPTTFGAVNLATAAVTPANNLIEEAVAKLTISFTSPDLSTEKLPHAETPASDIFAYTVKEDARGITFGHPFEGVSLSVNA